MTMWINLIDRGSLDRISLDQKSLFSVDTIIRTFEPSQLFKIVANVETQKTENKKTNLT